MAPERIGYLLFLVLVLRYPVEKSIGFRYLPLSFEHKIDQMHTASIIATIPPFCASAIACIASVVFPEDSVRKSLLLSL